MVSTVQMLLGLVIGVLGFRQIAENPLTGCSALFLGGFLILVGLDHFLGSGPKAKRTAEPDRLP
jgi:sulfite exporter TauE/SafE